MKSKLGRCKTIVLHGYDSIFVDVEAEIQNGIPDFQIIGLADNVVKESRRRVKSALNNSGFEFPNRKIIVNLAPAEIIKKGSHIDLAIAMSILKATGQLEDIEIDNYIFLGELSLTGSLNHFDKAIPLLNNWKINKKVNEIDFHIFLPKLLDEEKEFLMCENLLQCEDLKDVVNMLRRKKIYLKFNKEKKYINQGRSYEERLDTIRNKLSMIYDQDEVKRALYISLAGYHHMLMIGPPGVGKTSLANIYGYMMSDIKDKVLKEVVSLYSYDDKLSLRLKEIKRPPIVSHKGELTKRNLIGGGVGKVSLGLCSLAHGGLLFLDEIDQLNSKILRLLAIILDEKKISIMRNKENFLFPADFTLMGATGPCKCGYYGDEKCKCSPKDVYSYTNKFTGSLMDRIDIHIRVSRGDINKFDSKMDSREKIKEIIKKIELANEKQYCRGRKNRDLTGDELIEVCHMDNKAMEFSRKIYDSMMLSGRGYEKVLKISRTVADFENEKSVAIHHIAEAAQYRLN